MSEPYRLATGDHAALRVRAREVEKGSNQEGLVLAMFAIMDIGNALGPAVGLAANQLGIPKRVITINCPGWRIPILNPEIVRSYGGKCNSKEGCLSFPGLEVMRIRSKRVEVHGFDLNWKPIKYKFKGLKSMIVQHEVDHLNGITIQMEQQ